jgi:hypothetical protein
MTDNKFNPDWDAMAVMVEEQQRMAKRIEELDIALAEQDAKYLDAVETLDDEGWTWDGDQWQRPATRSEKLREARITRRPRGWSKEDEPEPVAWTVGGLITDFSRDFSAYKTKTYTQPLYTTPPQRKPEPKPVAWMLTELDGTPLIDCGDLVVKPRPILVGDKTDCIPLYTAPPQREWVGLTNAEYEAMAEQYVTNCYFDTLKYARAIEAKLKEKNA